MASKVIGTTGLIGSGKDTIADLLCVALDAPKLNISDIVRQDAAAANISSDREPLTNYSKAMHDKFGATYFTQRAIQTIQESHSSLFVLSGIRVPEEVVLLRETFGSEFYLLAAQITDDDLRHQRILDRKTGWDPADKRKLTENDTIQIRNYRLDQTVALADKVIENSGSLQELNNKVDAVCSLFCRS